MGQRESLERVTNGGARLVEEERREKWEKVGERERGTYKEKKVEEGGIRKGKGE